MTASERAKQVIDAVIQGRQPFNSSLEEFITQAIEAAVAEEREACAQRAEAELRSWNPHSPDPQTRIAAAIRARKGDGT